MSVDLILFVRNSALAFADTGKFKFWSGVREALEVEGCDPFLIRRLEGDAYFQFRLRQRMKAAQSTANA